MKTFSSKKQRNEQQLGYGGQIQLKMQRYQRSDQNLVYSHYSLFNDAIKQINPPTPKRATKQKYYLKEKKSQSGSINSRQSRFEKVGNRKTNIQNKQINKQNEKNSNKKSTASDKLKNQKLKKKDQVNNKSNQAKNNLKGIKKDSIGQILQYYLGQSSKDKGSKLQTPMKTVYEWENKQIQRFVDDPNLGDYIIKFPNPDNISDDYLELFPQAKNQGRITTINYQTAIQFYNDMFSIDERSKKKLQSQKLAFKIGFYILNLEQTMKQLHDNMKSFIQVTIKREQQSVRQKKGQFIEQFMSKEIELFSTIFNYYTSIEHMSQTDYKSDFQNKLSQLNKIIDMEHQLQIHKQELSRVIQYDAVKFEYHIDMSIFHLLKKQALSKHFNLLKHKQKIFDKFLIPYVQKYLEILSNDNSSQFNTQFIKSIGYSKNLQQLKIKYTFLLLLTSFQKISTFFSYFLTSSRRLILKFIDKQLQKQPLRKVIKGNYLQKVIQGQNILWTNNKCLPKDLYTLLRNCAVFQITQNCHLRARSFLSKNQEQIILVVKASEEVLQYYTQKNEMSTQIQIGAVDLFSFQPVDQFLRPLRLNNYVKDQDFIKKYSLKSCKLDKDDQNEQKSIESEALNLYKKVQQMNPDELRVKIILDQQDCDQCFRWVGNQLNIKFIDSKILVNKQNNEQFSRQTWECYYIYNKLIKSFIKRIRKTFQGKNKSTITQKSLIQFNNNIGFLLRIMFIKALTISNQLFYNNREKRGLLPTNIQNIFLHKRKLQSLWDKMDIRQPSGYFQYVKNKSLERIWRKYEVNERKQRSKFFPAQRLQITNKLLANYINIGRSLQKSHIAGYFPLHDPFILKNIKIQPYLQNLKLKISTPKQQEEKKQQNNIVNKMYALYESQNAASDFTKLSVQKKLSLANSLFRRFSTQAVRFYCGQKIAFYFQFVKYLAIKAFPFIIPAFIIQILIWAQHQDIIKKGQSELKYLNDALVLIVTLFNMVWTTNLIQKWKQQQRFLAQKFGVANIGQNLQKRPSFVGKYRRNFQTDEINFEYVPKKLAIVKSMFTFVINLLYITLVSLLILQVFILKTYLFQKGFSQSTVNVLPAILIALIGKIFGFLYIPLIKLITSFQNHRTIANYEQSLISKSYIINFVITFISVFIYAFFADYLDADYLCIIKTADSSTLIYNCDYFVGSQLLSLVLIDLAFAAVFAVSPYIKFRLQQYFDSKKRKPTTKFYYNKFQSIDQFYQEQDRMPSYMFNDELDNSWDGYMNIINILTALALFAPALPCAYVFMFVNGVLRLHSSKYEMIYLVKRSIPIKANSINWWLPIIQIISILAIITNLVYMIYTRKVFQQNQTQILFFLLIAFFLIKIYLYLQYKKGQDSMGRRLKQKVSEVLLLKGDQKYMNQLNSINTDILNVFYDESKLKRKTPNIKKANILFNNQKETKETSTNKAGSNS